MTRRPSPSFLASLSASSPFGSQVSQSPTLCCHFTNEDTLEFDASQGPTTVVVAGADLMEVDMAKSKKRARRDSSEDDATTEKKVRAAKKSKAGKKSNKYKKPKQTPIPILTMKSHYDAAFPVDAVVDQNMPAYLMAKNYIDIYGTCLPSVHFRAC